MIDPSLIGMPFRYLTVVSFILCVFHPYTVQWFNLYFLTLVVFVLGSYLFWVYPQKMVIELPHRDQKVILQGSLLKATDLAFHVFPFLCIALCYGAYYHHAEHKYDTTLLASIGLLFAYVAVTRMKHLEKMYLISIDRLVYLFMVTVVLYVVFV